MKTLKRLLLASIFLAGIHSIAAAATVGVYLMSGDEWEFQPLTEISDGIWSCQGSFESNVGSISNFWVTVKTDPFIAYGFTATNFSSNVQSFGFSLLPGIVLSPSILGPTKINASIAGGITDNNNDGVTMAPPVGSDKIQINFTDSGTPEEFSWSVGPADTKGPQPGFGSFPYVGEFMATSNGPWAPVMFGEIVQFTLTPGDTAAITGFCEITAVPIPASVLMLGSGLMSLVGIRRRIKR